MKLRLVRPLQGARTGMQPPQLAPITPHPPYAVGTGSNAQGASVKWGSSGSGLLDALAEDGGRASESASLNGHSALV